MSTACVTGATAGIGAAFAQVLAARGYDLILVARDETRLAKAAENLRANQRVLVEVLPADLCTDVGCAVVSERLADSSRPVEILVNNAGFGLNQPFLGGDLASEEAMLNVLVRAVLRLSHAVFPGMVQRGAGSVINVSSIAGWLPNGTYSAAKAWVTVFSESMAAEVRGSGVTVTAVCPGLTHTEFHQRAQMRVDVMPEWLWLDAEKVARDGLDAALNGRAVNVPSYRYQAMALATRYLPRPLVRKVSQIAPVPRRRH